jgi:WXXGXW repeat (2 copies)
MKKQILIAASAFFMAMVPLANAQVVVRIGPPARVVEHRPPPPHEHPNWAWHAGYHRWDGNRYVWVPGTYVAPPRAHAVWVEGSWVHERGGYVWHEGHWR